MAAPLIAIALLAAYRTARLGWADRLEPARAARAEPASALHALRLADAVEGAGGDPRRELDRAAAASPLDAGIRVRIGLRAEIDGDIAGAERQLLEAARLSRKFQPRWTLANFYFRRGRHDDFWRWMRAALDISYGDRAALFDLCWRTAPDAGEILRRAVPSRREVRMEYARFLLSRQQWDAGGALAVDLAGSAVPAETGYFLEVCDRLLGDWRVTPAAKLWDLIGERSRLAGQGFAWRVPQSAGVSVVRLPEPGGWRIAFSGHQPERCEILWRFVALGRGESTPLVCHYDAALTSPSMESPPTGLRWILFARSGAVLAESPALDIGEDRKTEVRLSVPRGVQGARLALVYERQRGATRIEGRLALRRIAVGEQE